MTIYRGFDLNRFRPIRVPLEREALRCKLGLPINAFIIGHAGAFKPEKNHALIVQVAQSLTALIPNTWLVMLGNGPLYKSVVALAHQSGIQFLAPGHIATPEDYYRILDLFFFPSWREGLPGAIVEAQACGIPVVCSNIPENIEAIPPFFQQFTFDLSGSMTQVVDSILTLRALAQCEPVLVQNEVRRWVEDHYDRCKNTAMMLDWFDQLLAARVEA